MAIAFDATAGSSGAGTSLTYSHTCTGTNLILFLNAATDGSGNIVTGATYAGVAMTLISTQNTTNNNYTQMYYLIAPATGANNIIITASGSGNLVANSASYTGAKQSGVPDSFAGGQFAATTVTQATTTVADNCWLVGTMAGNRGISAGTGTVIHGGNQFSIFDSGGAKTPPGSYALQFIQSDTATSCFLVASFAPAAGTAANSNFFLFM